MDSPIGTSTRGPSDIERVTMRIVSWRVLPIVCGLYVVAFIDRVALGYAQLKMGAELGIDPAFFGLVAGIFFAGYLLFEIPSNAALYRFGARKWLARIGVTWGLVTVLTGLVQNEWQLLIARFLLGVAEAGLAPGAVLYFAMFFPAAYRAKSLGFFFIAAPLSGVIAGPLSGVILDHANWLGLSSWRWIFILFGVPAVFLGIITSIWLADSPARAKWLSPTQKDWLANRLEKDSPVPHEHAGAFLRAVRDPRVLALSVVQFLVLSGVYGIAFWTPQIVKSFSQSGSSTVVGLLAAIPFLAACITTCWTGQHSDKKMERPLHIAVPVAIGGVALLILPWVHDSAAISLLVLTVAAAGTYAYPAPFWAITQGLFTGPTAAVAIAAVGALSSIGSLVSPYIFGWITKATGSTNVGILYLGGSLLLGAVLMIAIRPLVASALGPTAGHTSPNGVGRGPDLSHAHLRLRAEARPAATETVDAGGLAPGSLPSLPRSID
ncbi:MAG: MFS transporter [Hyphomicrobiales bacterium]|nr:MAG: MFS transporter [Hyphomicrobiales bacterium]